MKKEKGFTLIELLVVIAIIAILATLVLIALGDARDSARDADRKSAISQMRSHAQLFYNEKPDSYVGLGSDPATPSTAANAISGGTLVIHSNATNWCAEIQLTGGSYVCTDNNLKIVDKHETAKCTASSINCN